VTSSTDFYLAETLLTAAERSVRDRVRAFAEAELRPVARDAWERGEFPMGLVPKLAGLGIAGGVIAGYGCPGLSSVATGLAMQELARVDSSFATFYTAHSGLAMGTIAACGSAEQKARWLPELARCEAIGSFALTEPEHGSDASHLATTARRDGEDYVLDGAKRWIGNATFCKVAVVWARVEDGIAAFLVECPNPGFRATPMTGKLAQRAVPQADIRLEGCRVPAANRLPVTGFRGAADVLARGRGNVAWGALGGAIACYEIALDYARRREQFGKPIASFQLVQAKLVRMLGEITKAQLLLVQLGRLTDCGKMTPGMAALAKATTTETAREVAKTAREILGGNGILQDNEVMRHMSDLEALFTYEGTFDVNALLVGREITGLSAFV
jgi:glutaryl-CoA dehydrogenase